MINAKGRILGEVLKNFWKTVPERKYCEKLHENEITLQENGA